MDKQKKENEVVSPSKNTSGTETSVQKLPGYQSQWTEQIDKIWNDYQNRGPFEFNVNEDALYQQYRDRYIRDGQIAMEDTLGQASALTGGYDNSYAQSVGQQTYNRYLEGLNDIVPELYAMALDRYTQQGNDMLAQYGLLMDRENQDYGRYQDAMSLARSQVDAMLSIGKRPSQDLIDQSGLSKEYVDAILSQFAGSSGGGNGGGGSSGGSSGSGRGTGKKPAPNKTGSGSGIDMDSILNLGRGPISGDYLADLVSKGEVIQKNDGNKISFENKKPPTSLFPKFPW